jgi:quinoprotein glucose dehydrogenase
MLRLWICLFALVVAPLWAAEPYSPSIAPASNEAESALGGFRLPEGVKGEVWAAEPMLANPVAFCIDEQGRIYVAETFRQGLGVEDNRGHMNWLVDDLAAETVEQRREYFKKHLGEKKYLEYGKEHDRIRLLVDTDHDGKADKATIFADGFNDPVDGTGAGLLARNGTVLYTCIPKLWSLRDTNGDGVADERKVLHDGYGVRVAFRGHDLHGLTMGPDGRVYFSIGDRGYNVEFEGKKFFHPETGAVFRCLPDGSELEEFAYGLRNPQELAFDDFGNLFTCDNNSDGGDRARWTYIVEGGDIGWRMFYQYLSDRGPWNREKIWHPFQDGHVAYTVPPIANFSDGPSGLVAYPGVGLPERYQGHFFLVDFRGGPGNSGVRSFGLKPNGATFEITDAHEFLWQILATDFDFGYDGSMYLADWVNGWTGLGKGRIYKFTHGEASQAPAVAEAGKLMSEGFSKRSADELAKLLDHPDRRIRMEAQFAMADRGFEKELIELSRPQSPDRVRRQAIWGLGQLARKGSQPAQAAIAAGLEVTDPEMRAQAARTLGDSARSDIGQAAAKLVALLSDESPRVQSMAAQAIGQLAARGLLKGDATFNALTAVLEKNADKDPIVRHTTALALSRSASVEQLAELAKHHSPAVRLGAVVALRRYRSPELVRFLEDSEPRVVAETVRAIYDEKIADAIPTIAALADRPSSSWGQEVQDTILRRVLVANFRDGSTQAASRIARIAGDNGLSQDLRMEALEELKLWTSEVPLDRMNGEYRPRKAASAESVASALRPVLGALFGGNDAVRKASADLAAAFGIKEVEPVLIQTLQALDAAGGARAAALTALDALNSTRTVALAEEFLKDPSELVRVSARRTLLKKQPAKAVDLLKSALETGTPTEAQAAIADLTALDKPEADAVLADWMTRLATGAAAPEIQLDLIEAARTRGSLKGALELWEKSLKSDDELAAFRPTLLGGNAERGQELFFGRSELSCRRCHTVNGSGAAVGPDLSKIAKDKNRDYLLESIVLPNKQIAKGFESIIVITQAGQSYAGIVKESGPDEVKLMQGDGSLVTIKKSEIDEQAKGISAMPADIVKKLKPMELRDLVEYLSTLK